MLASRAVTVRNLSRRLTPLVAESHYSTAPPTECHSIGPSHAYHAAPSPDHRLPESVLETIPSDKDRYDAMRITYGLNRGKLVENVPIPAAAQAIADEHNFDLQICKFDAAEERRPPR